MSESERDRTRDAGVGESPDTGSSDPADESEFVNPDDLQVGRDGDGNRLPETVQAGDLGKIKVLPLAYGDVEKFFGDGEEADLDADMMAELFDRFIVQPDLSKAAGGRVTADYIRNMPPLAPRDIILAIMDVSGIEGDVDVDDEGNASVEVAEGN